MKDILDLSPDEIEHLTQDEVDEYWSILEHELTDIRTRYLHIKSKFTREFSHDLYMNTDEFLDLEIIPGRTFRFFSRKKCKLFFSLVADLTTILNDWIHFYASFRLVLVRSKCSTINKLKQLDSLIDKNKASVHALSTLLNQVQPLLEASDQTDDSSFVAMPMLLKG